MLFQKDKVYELALSSVKEEFIHDFLEKYIPGVYPIITDYGGSFLLNGTIGSSMNNVYPAKSFALLEWPSIQAFFDIIGDERIGPLLEARNGYLDFIHEGCFFSVSDDIDFKTPENGEVEMILLEQTLDNERGVLFEWIMNEKNNQLSPYLVIRDTGDDIGSGIIEKYTLRLL